MLDTFRPWGPSGSKPAFAAACILDAIARLPGAPRAAGHPAAVTAGHRGDNTPQAAASPPQTGQTAGQNAPVQ
jgi:hypothetical protein